MDEFYWEDRPRYYAVRSAGDARELGPCRRTAQALGAGGWPDHFHFLELLSELGERFGVRVHAYVPMDNHYHLLLETPEANLSRAMHWLNAYPGYADYTPPLAWICQEPLAGLCGGKSDHAL